MPSRPHPAHHEVERGRGAPSNAVPQRFGLAERLADGDWLDEVETIDGAAGRRRTTVTEEHPRSILTFNTSPDIGFDRSINAYRGCEHVMFSRDEGRALNEIDCAPNLRSYSSAP
jgi:hypothetical protein